MKARANFNEPKQQPWQRDLQEWLHKTIKSTNVEYMRGKISDLKTRIISQYSANNNHANPPLPKKSSLSYLNKKIKQAAQYFQALMGKIRFPMLGYYGPTSTNKHE